MALKIKDPLKIIDEMKADLQKLESEFESQSKLMGSLILDQKIGDKDLTTDIENTRKRMNEIEKEISATEFAISEATDRNRRAIREKEKLDYLNKVKFVRDEIKPKAISHFVECEKHLETALKEFEKGAGYLSQATAQGLQTDGTTIGDSPLGENQIMGHFRLLLRKYGPTSFAWARIYAGSPKDIPTFKKTIEQGFDWYLKNHKGIE